jgi:hypothetical protein
LLSAVGDAEVVCEVNNAVLHVIGDLPSLPLPTPSTECRHDSPFPWLPP